MFGDTFDLPYSLIEKVSKIIENKNPLPPGLDLHEISPPNPKIEKWIKANKGRFEKEYGAEKGKEVLYARAWKMHEEELELEASGFGKEPEFPEDKKEDDDKPKKGKEKIIMNPMVEPEKISSPDPTKMQKIT
jgi:hypothetical protein